jgi:hypothetical protein
MLDMGIDLKEESYMDGQSLTNVRLAKNQLCGSISFSSLTLKGVNIPYIEAHLKRKLVFPSHF